MRFAVTVLLLTLSACASGANEEALSSRANASRYVLEQFAAVLNKDIPQFRDDDPRGFVVVNGRPANFFVFNLVDTTNSFSPLRLDPPGTDDASRVPFILNERGVFHFAPLQLSLSYSHIAILDHGHLKVFGFVNCEGRGASLRDIIQYATQLGYSDAMIDRLQHYRTFGVYIQTDPQSHVVCK